MCFFRWPSSVLHVLELNPEPATFCLLALSSVAQLTELGTATGAISTQYRHSVKCHFVLHINSCFVTSLILFGWSCYEVGYQKLNFQVATLHFCHCFYLVLELEGDLVFLTFLKKFTRIFNLGSDTRTMGILNKVSFCFRPPNPIEYLAAFLLKNKDEFKTIKEWKLEQFLIT